MKCAPTLWEFELIFQSICDTDKINYSFVVDVKSDIKMQLKNNIFQWNLKVLSENERSVFQLLDTMRLNDKGLINSYKTTAKTHATMDKKFNILLYAENLHFLLTKCGWRVRNARAHYIFEQSKFKKDFVIMNQVSSQNGATDVERDFFKLMNNSNFGYDCRNNADNCLSQPIYDEIEELSYTKKYQNVFDQEISDFVSSEILKRQIEEEYLSKFAKLDPQDEYFDAKNNSWEIQKKKKKDFDTTFLMKKSRQKTRKTKSMIEFDASFSRSVKSLAAIKKK